jgi:hypothetical protein
VEVCDGMGAKDMEETLNTRRNFVIRRLTISAFVPTEESAIPSCISRARMA